MTNRDRFIISSYKLGESAKKISELADCCEGTVFNVLKRNGISTNTRKLVLSEKEKDDIIKEYISGKSIMKLSRETGIYQQRIKDVLNEEGVTLLSYSRLLNTDMIEDYFSNIDTKDKAYWIGWIVSDGAIYKNSLQFSIQMEDKYILDMLSNDIGVKNKVHTIEIGGKKYSKFYLGCKNIVKDLNKLGIYQNKTFTVSINNICDKELEPHLIRGLFDGDGCIYVGETLRKNNIRQTVYELSFTGNENIISYIKNVLESSIDGLSKKEIESNGSVKKIRWSGLNDIKMIRDYMYADEKDHFLVRKRDKLYLLG